MLFILTQARQPDSTRQASASKAQGLRAHQRPFLRTLCNSRVRQRKRAVSAPVLKGQPASRAVPLLPLPQLPPDPAQTKLHTMPPSVSCCNNLAASKVCCASKRVGMNLSILPGVMTEGVFLPRMTRGRPPKRVLPPVLCGCSSKKNNYQHAEVRAATC